MGGADGRVDRVGTPVVGHQVNGQDQQDSAQGQ